MKGGGKSTTSPLQDEIKASTTGRKEYRDCSLVGFPESSHSLGPLRELGIKGKKQKEQEKKKKKKKKGRRWVGNQKEGRGVVVIAQEHQRLLSGGG